MLLWPGFDRKDGVSTNSAETALKFCEVKGKVYRLQCEIVLPEEL
jgi:hypothetical protein